MSAIVGTLLVVLLVVVAVAIVWVVVRNTLEDSASNLDFDSVTIDLDIENVIVYRDMTTVNDSIAVTVKRSAGDEGLTAIKFVFADGNTSESFEETAVMEELELKTFNLTLSLFHDSVVGDLESVSIAPMIEEEVGQVLETFNLTAF